MSLSSLDIGLVLGGVLPAETVLLCGFQQVFAKQRFCDPSEGSHDLSHVAAQMPYSGSCTVDAERDSGHLRPDTPASRRAVRTA